MLRIYNFARGARGLRVMWQCEEMGLPYAVERVGYPASAAYRERYPLGPALATCSAAGLGSIYLQIPKPG